MERRVLLATSSPTESFAFRALKDSFDVAPVTSIIEAQEKLAEPFGVIVCASLLGESCMFDLLRYCKSMEQTRTIPFVCVKARGGRLDGIAYEGVGIALKALGAGAFVVLYRWTGEYGTEQAYEKLRYLVRGISMNRRRP